MISNMRSTKRMATVRRGAGDAFASPELARRNQTRSAIACRHNAKLMSKAETYALSLRDAALWKKSELEFKVLSVIWRPNVGDPVIVVMRGGSWEDSLERLAKACV